MKSGTEMVDSEEIQMLRQLLLDKVEINNNLRLMWRDSVLARTIRYSVKWLTILVSAALGISKAILNVLEIFF